MPQHSIVSNGLDLRELLPHTVFNISAPVSLFGIKSGVGLVVESDNIGFDKDINISAAYSYLMDMGSGKLGIGINLGMLNKTLDPKWFIPDGDAHTPISGDPLIPENKESFIAFDAGLGLYYKTDKYYAALSVTHINQPKIKFSKGMTICKQTLLSDWWIYSAVTRSIP